MIAVLKHGTTPEQTQHLVKWLANMNLDVHISFPDEKFTKELPDTVTAALMHKEE